MKVYRSKKMQQEIIRTYDELLGQWDVAIEEMDIDTTYGRTHVIACGDEKNPPLLLFHGVGDDSALMWIYNAKYLSQYYRLYAIDTIGGPGKSVPGKLYNKDFNDVTWIDEVLKGLFLEKAYFAGVSMGAYLVQLYTLKRPEKVLKGICISGTVPTGQKNNMSAMMKIFLPEALFPTPKNVQKLIRKLCGSRSCVFTENRRIMEHFTCLLKGFNNMAMGYHNVRGFDEAEIDSIRDKLEFLVGKDDPFQKMGGEKALVHYQMKASFYPDAGHGLNHELADEINRKMVEIFKQSVDKDEIKM